MVALTVWLWLFSIAYAVASEIARNAELPKRAVLAAQTSLSLIMVWWVLADARKRRQPICHDYDAFVFFAWPASCRYLLRTRSFRGLLVMHCIAAVWLLTSVFVAFFFAI
jgi:ABC-type transport system involved in cytochrome c biogenesis permease subunit